MKLAKQKGDRISIRLDASQKTAIDRAASILGVSRSSFMLANAVEAAARVIGQENQILLSQRDWEKFLEIVSADIEPTEAARKAALRYKEGLSACTTK